MISLEWKSGNYYVDAFLITFDLHLYFEYLFWCQSETNDRQFYLRHHEAWSMKHEGCWFDSLYLGPNGMDGGPNSFQILVCIFFQNGTKSNLRGQIKNPDTVYIPYLLFSNTVGTVPYFNFPSLSATHQWVSVRYVWLAGSMNAGVPIVSFFILLALFL